MSDEAFRPSFLLLAHSASMLALRTPDEVDLGRPDIRVASKLPDLVHRGAIADGVVDSGLPKRVDANPSAPKPLRINSCRAAVLLDEPPGGLSVQVPADESQDPL